MTDKPVAKADVHVALTRAVELMDKKLGHSVTRSKFDSFLINGRWLRELAHAKEFADGVAKEAGPHAGVHPTVVQVDVGHYIAGFVAPEVLASLKQQVG